MGCFITGFLFFWRFPGVFPYSFLVVLSLDFRFCSFVSRFLFLVILSHDFCFCNSEPRILFFESFCHDFCF